ncbi:MAG: hypothetical protein J7L94_12685 [Caldisericaceae bacterium]|nr:hypothetical protein [Caldisericaceae bacterium]
MALGVDRALAQVEVEDSVVDWGRLVIVFAPHAGRKLHTSQVLLVPI